MAIKMCYCGHPEERHNLEMKERWDCNHCSCKKYVPNDFLEIETVKEECTHKDKHYSTFHGNRMYCPGCMTEWVDDVKKKPTTPEKLPSERIDEIYKSQAPQGNPDNLNTIWGRLEAVIQYLDEQAKK